MAAGKTMAIGKFGVSLLDLSTLCPGNFLDCLVSYVKTIRNRHSKPFKEIELRDLSMGFILISVLLYEFVFGWWVTNLSTRDFFCIDHGPTSGDPLGSGGWTFGPGTGAELVRAFSADQG